MAKNPRKWAGIFDAKIVGTVPDLGGGAFDMEDLARIMHQRLAPSPGERTGRPSDPEWVRRPKVPMTEQTVRRLTAIAESLSTDKRKVSPMQVAAHLLEEAIARVSV